MTYFYRSEKGSVSIFFLIILIALFFFNAVLIDYARVFAAKQQTEALIRSGVRSVASAYDTDLQEKYGLFAVSDQNIEHLFQQVLERNTSTESNGFMQFVPLRLEENQVVLNASAPLADERIFTRQVLEEMKIRAPIDFTLGIVDKFLFRRDQVEQTEQTIELLEAAQDDVHNRDKALQRLAKVQADALEALRNINGSIEYAVSSELASDHATKLFNKLSSDAEYMQELLAEGREQLNEVRTFNEKLKQQIGNQEGRAGSDELTQIEGAIRDTVLLESEIHRIEQRLAEQEQELLDLQQELGRLSQNKQDAVSLRHQLLALGAYTKKMIRQWEEGLRDQQQALKRMKEQQAESEALEEQYEQEYQQTEIKVLGLIDRLKALTFRSEELEAVEELAQSYRAFNQKLQNGVQSGSNTDVLDIATNDRNDSFIFLNGMMDQLSSFSTGIRNELYLNEYINQRFQAFPPQRINELLQETDTDQLEQLLRVRNQEIEYVLYGNTRGAGNVAAAFGEIFALRYAYNMMKAVRICAGAGHPGAILACILAKAMKATLSDLQTLIQGRSVTFFGVPLNYQDHLRLFLFFHPGNHRLYRMQALIHHHTGKDLAHFNTYLESSGECSLPLWFLPQIFRLFAAENEHVQGNRFYIHRKAVYSY